ncbi:MAG: FHA domain-containing protein [Betaproteobacteria bacterium]|nr:FHA domain-containing protein [Betaproteobacteria bacterium]
MAKLILSGGSVSGHYFIDNPRFSIGRSETNDVVLDDAGASKLHALILTVGNDQILEDQGSTNGTWVNGTQVNRHILQNNDVIRIAGFQLKYVNQRALREMDFDKTMVLETVGIGHRSLGPGFEAPGLHTAAAEARARRANFPLGVVRITQGPATGEEVVLSRVVKAFGPPGVQQAVITRRPHGYYLTHVVGRRHPKVNGRSVGAKPYALQDQDVVEIADAVLVFALKA